MSRLVAVSRTLVFASCFTAGVAYAGAVFPTASINDVSLNEGNAGTTAFTFTISLDVPNAAGATVSWQTVNGTAVAPSDFTAASGVATFAPGDTSETVTILVNGDVTIEPNESFLVELTGASGAGIGADFQGTGTILGDDISGDATSDVPTASEWALLLLATALGVMAIRKL